MKLYGDDFDDDRVAAWFMDEKEAYFNLRSTGPARSAYEYHALNKLHGFDHLPRGNALDVLGFGSAFGHELEPILKRCRSITILDPGSGFARETLSGVPVRFVRPTSDGSLPFTAASYDLITCFGVLHHIPTVSATIREFHRCLRIGGHALIREPTVSMGDWRHPRVGLTKRERGIPRRVFREIAENCGFVIEREQPCMFALTGKLQRMARRPVFNSEWVVRLDQALCRLPFWSHRYHAERSWQKFRSTAVAYVLTKP